MPETHGWSKAKKFLVGLSGLVVFFLMVVFAARLALQSIFWSTAANKATGLSQMDPSWDLRNRWTTGHSFGKAGGSVGDFLPGGGAWIARNAEIKTRSAKYDDSVRRLREIVATHRGFLEDLRTLDVSGRGRALGALVSVPSDDFDSTLRDLQTLGKTESITQEGEDSAVKLATAARHVESSQTSLARLQALQQERRGNLADAMALEKEIAAARDAAAEAEHQNNLLMATVAQAHIEVSLLEDYRAPLRLGLTDAGRDVWNALADGVNTIFTSVSGVLSLVFSLGLPLGFWALVLFWPARALWGRFRRGAAQAPAS